MYLCFLCSFVLIYFRMLFISYSNVANNIKPGHETSSKDVEIVWSKKHLAIDVKDESKRIRTRVQLLIQALSLGQTISLGSVCTIIHRQTVYVPLSGKTATSHRKTLCAMTGMQGKITTSHMKTLCAMTGM